VGVIGGDYSKYWVDMLELSALVHSTRMISAMVI
jgi:hypothetical protein